jgi:WD40 repeat protein
VSHDEMFIAFGDSNKYVSLFPFEPINENLKKVENDIEKFTILKSDEPTKINMEAHSDSVNSLVFTKLNHYHLISGSSDKTIIIWRINPKDLTAQNVRLLRTHSDVTELALLPNDEVMFVGCVDNNIYLYKANFQANAFEYFSCVNIHQTYVTSICLDPFIEKNIHINKGSHLNTSIKFVSYV